MRRSLPAEVAYALVGAPSKGGTCTPQSTPERLKMVGMNHGLLDLLSGSWMFRPEGAWYIGRLRPFFRVCPPNVFDPRLDAWLQCCFGASRLAGMRHLRTDRQHEVSLPPVAIGTQAQIICLSDDRLHPLHRLSTQRFLSLPVFQLPQETTGSIEPCHGPALRRMRRHIFLHGGLRVVAFGDQFKKFLHQGRDQPHLLKRSQSPFPFTTSLLALLEHPCCGIPPHALSPSFQYLQNLTQRGAQPFHDGIDRRLQF